MNSENHLLAYVRSGDEAAFAKIVEAYSSLVYGTAYRKTRNVQLAEEITQNVFILLARKAEKLVSRPNLGGWLHRTTILDSQNLLRSEAARQRRVEQWKKKSDVSSEKDIEIFFERVDDALDQLSESDRMVVMMRFFEEKEFREIGAKVGKSADAVQKQIRRALDKLNRSLTAKGATFSLATIGLVLSSELAKAAPVASSAVISAKAVTATSSVSGAGHLLANFFHIMNTFKTSTVVGAVLLVATIPAVMQHSQAKEIQKELTELSVRKKSLGMTRSSSVHEATARNTQTPVGRILASSKKALSGQEFLEEMERMMMSQNMSQMYQLFLPLTLMSDAELQTFVAEMESAEAVPHIKAMMTGLVLETLPVSGEDRGSLLARRLANSEYVRWEDYGMSNWVKEDLEGAVTWFKASQADGTLLGKGVDSPEHHLGAIIAGKLAEQDVQRALELVQSVEPSGRGFVLAEIAEVLAEEGREGLSPLVDAIKELHDIDAVIRVVDAAAEKMVKNGQRDEVLLFLEND